MTSKQLWARAWRTSITTLVVVSLLTVILWLSNGYSYRLGAYNMAQQCVDASIETGY